MIGTNSVLMGKACAGLLANFFKGDNIFASVWTYLIVLAYALFATFWLYRLNQSLKLYDALFIIPAMQCVWLLFGILGGQVFYQEYKQMTPLSSVFFCVGVTILLIGFVTLRPSLPAPSEDPEDLAHPSPHRRLREEDLSRSPGRINV